MGAGPRGYDGDPEVTGVHTQTSERRQGGELHASCRKTRHYGHVASCSEGLAPRVAGAIQPARTLVWLLGNPTPTEFGP